MAAFLLGGLLVGAIFYFSARGQETAESTPLPATTAPENSQISSTTPEPQATAVIPAFNFPTCPPVNFAIIGDYGQDNQFAQQVADLIQSQQPDFVATVGDNNYPDGAADTIDDHIGKYYHSFIGNYQGSYGPGATSNNFYPALGNHDWRTHSGDPPLPHVYLDYFTLPGNERYYSVVRGSVEIFVLDMDVDEPDGYKADSVQAQWLQAQLAASTATWKLVISHHAPYSSGTGHGSTEVAQWPYAEWGADAVFSGDEHNYERLLVDGLPYFVNGLSGTSGVTGFRETAEAGSIVRYNRKHGAIFLEANCYRLTTQFMTYDDKIIDHYTLTQSPLLLNLTADTETPQPGQKINYTLEITNPTAVDITQAAISVTLPAGLEMTEAATVNSLSGNISQNSPQFPIVALNLLIPAGESIAVTLPATVSRDLAQETSLLLTVAVASPTDDIPGLATLLATVTYETLVARGASWRYLDDGSDQGTTWYAPDFDDRDWSEGQAAFAYSGEDMTEINFGPDKNDKYITTYFRTSFFVENAAAYTALPLRLRRDDGAVVYLNGREAYRNNMPDGSIDYQTRAEDTISAEDEDNFLETSLEPGLLVDGWNSLAVEIHQSSNDSSDMFFDLELSGDTRPVALNTNSVLFTTDVTQTATATPSPTLITDHEIFHVASDGDDEKGDGSADEPWATISYASDQVPDDSIIWVQPGTYVGYINLRARFDKGVKIISAVPYQARLRHNSVVVNCHLCRGITLEGFDIAHSGPGASQYVMQIQDAEGKRLGGKNITLRNNVLHDSYNNDIIKVNNGADQVLIENNIFYNQSGLDSHIDVNSATNITIQDNIFFNDFEGSGRINNNDTGSLIVVKDSNGDSDGIVGSTNIVIRRNVMLNWQGEEGNTFIVIGEDSVDYYPAYNVLIENNLMLGNSPNVIRAAFGVKGGRDITFRHNTVVGNLPGKAFAMRLTLQENNLPNENIRFYNNIWSDPTGTMGSEGAENPNDFSDTLPEETKSFELVNNLYWNGGLVIPVESGELVDYADDPAAVLADPRLPVQTNIVLPRWQEETGRFADGSTSIREAFLRLVMDYGALAADSPAMGRAAADFAATEDIVGSPRGAQPDIGAYEYTP